MSYVFAGSHVTSGKFWGVLFTKNPQGANAPPQQESAACCCKAVRKAASAKKMNVKFHKVRYQKGILFVGVEPHEILTGEPAETLIPVTVQDKKNCTVIKAGGAQFVASGGFCLSGGQGRENEREYTFRNLFGALGPEIRPFRDFAITNAGGWRKQLFLLDCVQYAKYRNYLCEKRRQKAVSEAVIAYRDEKEAQAKALWKQIDAGSRPGSFLRHLDQVLEHKISTELIWGDADWALEQIKNIVDDVKNLPVAEKPIPENWYWEALWGWFRTPEGHVVLIGPSNHMKKFKDNGPAVVPNYWNERLKRTREVFDAS